MENELTRIDHRPYPLPSSPWIMTQTWENILFIHWRGSRQIIASLLPAELELDTFDGECWITALPFRVTHQRIRMLPEIPFFNTFLELNVRTYVKYHGTPGVFFFSLDTNHPLAVCGAKTLSLPYKHAKMKMIIKDQTIFFKSKRVFSKKGNFDASYRPISSPVPTEDGSLDSWLLERYCLFTKWGGHLLRGDIHHEKWLISKAEAAFTENTVGPFGAPNEKPLLHFSSQKKTYIWGFKKVN